MLVYSYTIHKHIQDIYIYIYNTYLLLSPVPEVVLVRPFLAPHLPVGLKGAHLVKPVYRRVM